MIKVFEEADKDFTSNGDAVIQPFKAKVHKEDNGKFYLDIEADISYVDILTANRIIVADMPQGAQAFRIKNPEKTKHKITIKAPHISYDAENYVIADSYVVDKNCNDAMDHLNRATDNPSPFQVVSDIAEINSYRCVRTSLYDAFSTVLERWGGHFVRDNYRFGIMSTIGRDNGVTVRYKKNLKDMTCTANWNNVVTKLMPVGKDGLLLDEVYLYSQTQYDIPFTKVVSFNQNIDQDLYKDADGNLDEVAYNNALIEDLRKQGQAYVDENCVPKVNYTLKANIEKVTDIGDTIEVIDEPMGVDIKTHIISYDYDCILGKYTELEFGNFQQKVSGLIDTVSSEIQQSVEKNNANLQVIFSDAIQHAQDTIMGMLGNSYVIYEGDKLLVVDALPKEEAHHVIMINSGGKVSANNGSNPTTKYANYSSVNGATSLSYTFDSEGKYRVCAIGHAEVNNGNQVEFYTNGSIVATHYSHMWSKGGGTYGGMGEDASGTGLVFWGDISASKGKVVKILTKETKSFVTLCVERLP